MTDCYYEDDWGCHLYFGQFKITESPGHIAVYESDGYEPPCYYLIWEYPKVPKVKYEDLYSMTQSKLEKAYEDGQAWAETIGIGDFFIGGGTEAELRGFAPKSPEWLAFGQGVNTLVQAVRVDMLGLIVEILHPDGSTTT